ncbi:glycosyltransferase family 4 protein [Henriciella algicola]|uniref:Glycosyltransferase n=1 Tax=Henriciella algicola TaxID=1608422 RepID=A0A399RCC0_9PROT|nr:glycosyltransferase family 4 protein [Henriciella algicola]RIJ29196.1 glycosyltransferase [Henriciella algicola]
MSSARRKEYILAGKAIVIQMGARRNYAVPAALAKVGRLEALYTDLAGTSGVGLLARALANTPLPARLRAPLARLGSRMPPEYVRPFTHTFDRASLLYEWGKFRTPDDRGRVLARRQFNAAWSKAMLAKGFGDATHVYAMMSGQTLEADAFLEKAKEAGLKIVADVTIAPSYERIVDAEYAANPGWGRPVVSYRSAMGSDNPAYPRMMTLADRFLCASPFVANDLINNWGADPETVWVEPYTLHPSWLELVNVPVEGRVLFPGSADLRKGIHYFARAASILRDRNRKFEFRVVGDVSDEVRYHVETTHLNFQGRLTRGQMVEEYERADVVALPTLAEGSAGVTYEALACGIPVITTFAAGSRVKDGVSGIIIPVGDPEALADAIEDIVRHREKRNRFASAARASMKSMAWDTYPDRLVKAVFADAKINM